eukprot:scaffold43259_cov66-Attheya_sp.AAC.1
MVPSGWATIMGGELVCTQLSNGSVGRKKWFEAPVSAMPVAVWAFPVFVAGAASHGVRSGSCILMTLPFIHAVFTIM